MTGLELSKKYYQELGEPMLKEHFPNVLPFLAVGLAGSGSECYGFDDAVSQDHDFEPGFCIFIPDESIVDDKTAFLLERAYAKLPKEFVGFKRNSLSAVGGNRHGVIRIGDFFKAKTGKPNGVLSIADWFSVPEYSLLEATNGEIFIDNYGLFTQTREALKYYPQDIWLKKLSGNLLLMGQSGQYNYSRCIKRNDTAAAQLAVFEFAKSALNVIFLLNKTYMPYYKWAFKAFKNLGILNHLSYDLEFLISSSNDNETAIKKAGLIENICKEISDEINRQELAHANTNETEKMAYIINDTIKDNNIRTLHILSAV